MICCGLGYFETWFYAVDSISSLILCVGSVDITPDSAMSRNEVATTVEGHVRPKTMVVMLHNFIL